MVASQDEEQVQHPNTSIHLHALDPSVDNQSHTLDAHSPGMQVHLGHADEFSFCQFWEPLNVALAALLRTEHQRPQRVDDMFLCQSLLALLSLYLLVVGNGVEFSRIALFDGGSSSSSRSTTGETDGLHTCVKVGGEWTNECEWDVCGMDETIWRSAASSRLTAECSHNSLRLSSLPRAMHAMLSATFQGVP